MALNDYQLEAEYKKWAANLSKDERKTLKDKGLDKPLSSSDSTHRKSSGAQGMQISKGSQTSEVDAVKLAIIARDFNEFAPVCGITPLDEVIEAEEQAKTGTAEWNEAELARVKADAISALFGYLFSPVNGNVPSPIEVCSKIYILCFTIRPELIQDYSLERIAKCFDFTRQAFSKRLIKQDAALNLHARTRKSVEAVSLYREGTKEWHREKKEAERAAKRKDYLTKWRAAKAAEVRAYQAIYRSTNRERLNAAKRKSRKTNP